MNYPDDLKYTETHEWVKEEKDCFLIGITDFAQSQLGDIVYVDFPEVGESIDKGEPLGEIESSKAVSEFNMPLTGEVLEVNESLEDSPERVNSDPYGSWLVKIRVQNPEELNSLLDNIKAKELYEEGE